MSATADKILQLRQLLAQKFGPSAVLSSDEVAPLGLPVLDEVRIPRAALTEIVCPSAEYSGGGLLLYGLLHAFLGQGNRAVLIDGKDSFQPRGLPQTELDRLLWLRCHHAWEAIKAADLAVRDGNVPLILLLLALNPAAELRKIPANAWHRLQMLAEKSAVTVLVFTPLAQVGSARLRLSVGGTFPLGKLHVLRHELLSSLSVRVERRRHSERRWADDDDETVRRSACA